MTTNATTDADSTPDSSPAYDRIMVEFFDADLNPVSSELFGTFGTQFGPSTPRDALDKALTGHWKISALDESPRDIWDYAMVVCCDQEATFGWDDLTLETDDGHTLDNPSACFPSDPDDAAQYAVYGNYYQDLHDPLHLINIVSAETPREAAVLAAATASHNGDGFYTGHEVLVREVVDQRQFDLSDSLFDDYFEGEQEVAE